MNLYSKIEPWSDNSKRYRLAKLVPEGLGTHQVESLSSYLIRLATSHWVSPTNLYKVLSVEVHGGRPPTLTEASRIDGYTKLSSHVADTLNALSPLDLEFRQLTFNAWAAVFAAHGCGLLREQLAWCPDCYRQDRSIARPRYNRLLWSLRAVEQCTDHGRILVETCAGCGSHQALLTASAHIGYCQKCDADLSVRARSKPKRSLSEKEKWKSDASTELLGALQSGVIFERAIFLVRFEEFLQRYRGSPKRMAKSLNLPLDSIRSWVTRGHKPEIRFFLEVCYRLDMPPLQFFLASGSLEIHRPRIEQPIRSKRPPFLSKEEIEVARKVVRRVLSSSKDIQKLQDVADKAEISVRVLKYRLPDEYEAVVKRIFERRAREKQERDKERVRRLKKRVYSLTRRGIYPSQSKVLESRSVLNSDLRVPFVRLALRDLQDEFLERHLEYRDDPRFMHHLRLSRRARPSREEVANHLRLQNANGRLR